MYILMFFSGAAAQTYFINGLKMDAAAANRVITREAGCAAHTLALTANGGGQNDPVILTQAAGAVPTVTAPTAAATATANRALCFHEKIITGIGPAATTG